MSNHQAWPRPIAPRQAAELCIKIAKALDNAHTKGVIHRDLKPSNILMDANGEPHVTDFGLARRESGEISITVDGAVLGTLFYMPPEQAKGKSHEADRRSDVYSLGVILYEMLTGDVPFKGEKRMVILQIQTEEPTPPRRRYPTIPRDLETICLKALNKEPERRYATARAIADDLTQCVENKPIKARRVTLPERAWLWCRRNPRSAMWITLAVVVLLAVTIVSREWRMRVQAKALVNTVLEADSQRVMEIIDRLPEFGRRAEPHLRYGLSDVPARAANKRQRQLHARWALARVFGDHSQIPLITEAVLDVNDVEFQYVAPSLLALERFQAQVAADMWTLLNKATADKYRRFRAGLVLASYEPDSDQWNEEDYHFLAEQLVATNAVYQPQLWPLLSEISSDLIEPLELIFVDPDRPMDRQLAAANALSVFVAEDSQRLANLLTQSTARQYEILYPRFAETADETALDDLRAKVREQPAEDLDQKSRIALGQERAGAAITLMRHGEREVVFEALRVGDDPESLTQFVHRCRTRGIKPRHLIELLDRAEELREEVGQAKRKREDRVLFALLLALGEFKSDELPSPSEPLIDRVADWYANDPSSAIHGAAGWLLRHWGWEQAATRVDEMPIFDHVPTLEEIGSREWFVLGIDIPDEDMTVETTATTTIYFTFVMFPAGEYSMGSPDEEEYHDNTEILHQVQLTRPIAVCDREIVWRQFNRYDGGRHHRRWQEQFKRSLPEMEPVFGVSWFESVAYCRWLTTRAGMDESDQSFASIQLPSTAESGFFELPGSTNWPIDPGRPGFRLLTEAEWEYVCRSGTRTAFSFGNDAGLLGNYGWFQDNSGEWSHPVGRLRPNLGGAFDIHGNLLEWCYDWLTMVLADGAVDPLGPPERSFRLGRGGNWLNPPRNCRAARRSSARPTSRMDFLGFRLAFSPSAGTGTSEQSSGAESAGR